MPSPPMGHGAGGQSGVLAAPGANPFLSTANPRLVALCAICTDNCDSESPLSGEAQCRPSSET